MQGTTGYTLYDIGRSVTLVPENILPVVNSDEDQQINSVNGFTLRFADFEFQGKN